MQRWPWFTFFIALGLALSSRGRDLIGQAFLADDPVVRSAAEPAMYRAVGIVLAAAIAEYLVRRWRQQRKAET